MSSSSAAKDKPPFGILQIDSRQPRAFDDNDIAFLRTYANLLAAAVDRLRAIGEARQARSGFASPWRPANSAAGNSIWPMVS